VFLKDVFCANFSGIFIGIFSAFRSKNDNTLNIKSSFVCRLFTPDFYFCTKPSVRRIYLINAFILSGFNACRGQPFLRRPSGLVKGVNSVYFSKKNLRHRRSRRRCKYIIKIYHKRIEFWSRDRIGVAQNRHNWLVFLKSFRITKKKKTWIPLATLNFSF
jgi:hypothetical protein